MDTAQLKAIEIYAKGTLTYLEELLSIDKFALDDMLLGHPGAYQQIANEYATASSYNDFMEKHVKEVYAQCYVSIKENALMSGIKLTEEGVKQHIQLEPQYASAISLNLKMKLRYEKIKALKESMSARGFMLKDLASLYIAGYFAKDFVTGENADAVVADAARTKIRRKPLVAPKT